MNVGFLKINFLQLKRLIPHFLLLNNDLQIIEAGDYTNSFFGLSEGDSFISKFKITKLFSDRIALKYFAKYNEQKIAINRRKEKSAHIYNVQVEVFQDKQLILLVFENSFKTERSSIKNGINNNKDSKLFQKEFINDLSHDIKTPLAAIQSSLDLIFRKQDLFSKELSLITKDYFDISFLEIYKVTVMLKNISLLSANIAASELIKEPTNFSTFLKAILEKYFSNYYVRKKFNIIILGVEKVIEIDRNLFSQVIINIIIHSLQHMERNEKINLLIHFNEQQMLLSFMNHRVMPIELLAEKISEIPQNKFENTVLARDDKLRLAVIDMIVVLHKGNFIIKNRSDSKTEFIISLII